MASAGQILSDESKLVEQVAQALTYHRRTIACAESCTGGLLAVRLTDRPGSSAYMMGGVVSYANAVKISLVGVKERTLAVHGAVSKQVACEMAEGVRSAIGTNYGVGITGIAGPDGATGEKPVGLVYIAVSSVAETRVTKNVFAGNRTSIRYHATEKALQMLMDVFAREEKIF